MARWAECLLYVVVRVARTPPHYIG